MTTVARPGRGRAAGQALVEFALTIPVLFMLAFGAWDMWTHYSLSQQDTRAAQALAEWISRRGAYTPEMGTAIMAGLPLDQGFDCAIPGATGVGRPHVLVQALDGAGNTVATSGEQPPATYEAGCGENNNAGWTPDSNWAVLWEQTRPTLVRVTIWQIQASPLPMFSAVTLIGEPFRTVPSGSAVMAFTRQLTPQLPTLEQIAP